jgi:hypothetical protein
MSMSATYLTTEQLSELIHYDARTIRTRLKDAVLLEGIHYIRPFGGRKLLFIWESIQRDIGLASGQKRSGSGIGSTGHSATSRQASIPMANGVMAHG